MRRSGMGFVSAVAAVSISGAGCAPAAIPAAPAPAPTSQAAVSTPPSFRIELAAIDSLSEDPNLKGALYENGVLTVTIFLGGKKELPSAQIDAYKKKVQDATGVENVVIVQSSSSGPLLGTQQSPSALPSGR